MFLIVEEKNSNLPLGLLIGSKHNLNLIDCFETEGTEAIAKCISQKKPKSLKYLDLSTSLLIHSLVQYQRRSC